MGEKKSSRGRTTENTRENGAGGRSKPAAALPWAVIGLSLTVGLGILLSSSSASGTRHPEPRPDITAETVIPASRYVEYARIRTVYAQAREIPEVLDGLYCHCDCSKHAGHRSLLTCFESDHGAACDICLTEAAIAHRMTMGGKSLEEIRAAIDALYGG